MNPLVQNQQRYHLRIDNLLNQYFEDQTSAALRLTQAMQYALLNGGKRTRPFLVYATGEMLGVNLDKLDVPAFAVECIHAYSLIHDDLPAMDDDELRRGKPTCHIAFDEATAILAGDALQTLAFDVLASPASVINDATKQLKLVKLLAEASGVQGMCAGQALDLAATDAPISQSQLQQLHNLKTGALFKVSVSMATILADDLPQEVTQMLSQYSEALGLAFQVQDDILDIVGDSDVIGKPQGSDQAQNKSTYPSLLGLEGAKTYLQQLHQQALHALDALPYNTRLLREFSDFVVNRRF
ncbi:(2E,6E)-farnesyl diphosphate synthase [Aliiglaciecola sp. 3_MG-2023]|uniref:(2E,6E)-farnesyl diphosphate synthase n=1 Tax=Aliiglaciecola sp. 3_MG-2023 TaxID=3062644 RepID=UPI0026E226F4|nr:farnesyl diphosphate synthase [Aliiglaciecola sp. 3_MG-2023]MDO6693958.1 (2E,6E)-farnesyl diphosphate synthase [Aliiglaciecola sp. 3_MG-2023]